MVPLLLLLHGHEIDKWLNAALQSAGHKRAPQLLCVFRLTATSGGEP